MYQLILCSAKGIVIPVYSGGFRFWFPLSSSRRLEEGEREPKPGPEPEPELKQEPEPQPEPGPEPEPEPEPEPDKITD